MDFQTTLFSTSVETQKKDKKLSFIKYMGSKYNHLDFIFSHFPKHHKIYVEVFGGSGCVLLNKEPSKIEIYNDLNEFLYTLFKVAQNEEKFKKLKHMLDYTLFSRKNFSECVGRYLENQYTDEIQKAYDIYVILTQGFNARLKKPSFAITFSRNDSFAFHKRVKNLEKIHNRLKSVVIECLDFRELLKKYNHPNTFYYVDPPYLEGEKVLNQYTLNFSKSDHEELIEIILSMKDKCFFLISGFENKIYNKLSDFGFKKAIKDTYSRSCSITRFSKSKTKKRVQEILWYNYIPKCKYDFKFTPQQKQQQTLLLNSTLHEQYI